MVLILYSNGRKVVCNVVSSLQRTAAIKVVISLWTSADLANSANGYCFHLSGSTNLIEKWKSLEDRVKCNVEKIVLPQAVKQEVLSLVKPIGLEIGKWEKMHKEQCGQPCNCKANLLSKLYWTGKGTIDKKKTAKKLVDDSDLDIRFRWELACAYCFESHVRKLWKEYNSKTPNHRSNCQCKHLDCKEVGWNFMVGFWDCVMRGRNPKDLDKVEIARRSCIAPLGLIIGDVASSGYISAAEYLLQQLMPEIKALLLFRFAEIEVGSSDRLLQYEKDPSAEVVFFWLTLLGEEEQRKVVERYASGVLGCFLEWPWQESFMKAATHLLHVLTGSQFEEVLKALVWKVMCGCEDYNYRSLFTEFWKHGLDIHKRHVIHECASSGELLGRLLSIGDRYNFQLILEDATVEEKKAIVIAHGWQFR